MDEELEALEREYFFLNMKDTWDMADHSYAEELRAKMRKIREDSEK